MALTLDSVHLAATEVKAGSPRFVKNFTFADNKSLRLATFQSDCGSFFVILDPATFTKVSVMRTIKKASRLREHRAAG